MLKTIEAILTMLREQEAALESEQAARIKRDDYLIESIKADSAAYCGLVETMLGNIRLAIIKLEGSEGVGHVQD